jgi:hypothetical protein
MIVEVDQQTPEWLQMRIGMVTASRLIDVVTRLKRKSANGERGDYAAGRHKYLMEIVAERLTGRSAEHYVTPYMEAGIENEPLARAAYEIQTGFDVLPGNFAIHPQIKWFGASADALANEGLAEFKCLKVENHLEILAADAIPLEFIPQMIGEMACYERPWNDFVSYGAGLPRQLQLYVKRLYRDDAIIAQFEEEVLAFLEDVADMLLKLSASAKPVAVGTEEV